MSTNYGPTSFFFTDPSKLSIDANHSFIGTDAFGPVATLQTTQFRTTSIVRSSSKAPVFAICSGQVFFQPTYVGQTLDLTKINIIIKPDASYAPLKIKYFIYRGIDLADWFTGDNVVAPNLQDLTQPALLQRIWARYGSFNALGPTDTLPAILIGYNPAQQAPTSLIDSYFNYSSSGFQLPNCEQGDFIGNFSAQLGIDIVLDYGDYQLANQTELFKLDLNFARQVNHVFDTTSVLPATAINIKRYQEYILRFIDAAAFWGSHIGCGKIKFIGAADTNLNSVIYNNILKFYQTPNNLYIYVQAEHGRSYNFYANNSGRTISGFTSSPQAPLTSGWPILITTQPTSVSTGNISTVTTTLQYTIDPATSASQLYSIIDIISPNNDLSAYPISELLNFINGVVPPATMSIGDTFPIIVKLQITNSGNNITNFYASFLFIYANLRIDNPAPNYFDYLWPANFVTSLNLPTSPPADLSYWATYDRSATVNLNPLLKIGAAIQNKMVVDTGKTSGNPGSSSPRRLYMAVLKRNSNNAPDYKKLNVVTFKSGISYNTTFDQYSLNTYDDKDFVVLKGAFLDNGVAIAGLTLAHNTDFEKNYSYIQLGITEAEYNELMYDNPAVPPGGTSTQILPLGADNVFFDLLPTTIITSDSLVKKFQVGLKYEDSSGNIKSTLNRLNPINNVFVYTIDGFYFFSKDFSNLQYYSLNYPLCKADFRPQTPFSGDYGFDWMRIADTNPLLSGDVLYNNIMGKLYTDSALSNVETNANKFNIDPNQQTTYGYLDYFNKVASIFQNLELEYKSQLVQFNNSQTFSKYYVPIVTLFPPHVASAIDLDQQAIFNPPFTINTINRQATLTCIVTITVSPLKIDLQFDKTALNVVCDPIPITVGTHYVNLTINFLKDIGVEGVLRMAAYYANPVDAMQYPQNIGLLRVKPNTKKLRTSKKVVLVPVSTNIGNGNNSPSPGSMTAAAALLMQFLRQALITPVLALESLDVSHSNSFNNNYVHYDTNNTDYVVLTENDQHAISPNNFVGDFLNILLQNGDSHNTARGNKYNNYFKFFYFAEPGGFLDDNGLLILENGVSQANCVNIFSSALDVTATHEFLHSLNMPHSFQAPESAPFGQYAMYTYKPLVTDNIMDYSPGATRHSLWNWQTYIASSFSDPEP